MADRLSALAAESALSKPSEIPLTPTLSPSDGEREKVGVSLECSPNSELAASDAMFHRPIG
jgi:hypothetical protein